jgi:hypothetical protein
MPNSDVVASELIAAREGSIDAPASSTSGVVPGLGRGRSVGVDVAKLSRKLSLRDLTDSQVCLLVSAALFVLAAWPLGLTEIPPYQDLPNHLAAVTVIENPAKYPEFAFNGFLKTNAALFAWLYVVGKVVGVTLAAKLFALLVVAANALAIPRFVFALTNSRKKVLVSALFAWPMIHNWFVSMGMLDFALSVPLSLALVIALERQRCQPTLRRALTVTGLGLVTWYAHVFPLLVVHLLVLLHVVVQPTWSARRDETKKLAVPLLPVTVLVCLSTYMHLRESVGPMTAFVHQTKNLAVWELVYNLWAEFFWGFTKLSLSTLVPCVLLGVFAFISFTKREKSPPFFSGLALAVLAILYCFTPYKVTNWYHVNSRLIPFIFFCMLLRVPERLPKRLVACLAVCGAVYSAAMGADFVRLEKDRQRFVAGLSAVPEGAHLLPLLFKAKATSDNTCSLLHAWGFYVVEKHTSAPLLFAHSRSFPVMYSTPPPIRFNHLVLENFAPDMAHPSQICDALAPVIPDDCRVEYQKRWAEFWRDATPIYDHVLMWDATPEALALVPPEYKVVFQRDELVIYARNDAVPTAAR